MLLVWQRQRARARVVAAIGKEMNRFCAAEEESEMNRSTVIGGSGGTRQRFGYVIMVGTDRCLFEQATTIRVFLPAAESRSGSGGTAGAVPVGVPMAAEMSSVGAFCTQCGSRVAPGSVFCGACGAKTPTYTRQVVPEEDNVIE